MIFNENQINRFFRSCLPQLKDNEVFIVEINARRKYYKELSKSTIHLKTIILRQTKDLDRVVQKLKREVAAVQAGYYDKGNKIPEEAIVFYIDPNPKDAIKATSSLQKEIMGRYRDLAMQAINKDLKETDIPIRFMKKIDIHYTSYLHKSNSRKLFWMFDVDTKDDKVIDSFKKELFTNQITPWNILSTANGYHYVVLVGEHIGTRFFGKEQLIKKINKTFSDIEFKKSSFMHPIPGMLQGGKEVLIGEQNVS